MYKIPDKTVFLGKKIISLPFCESTNTQLISLAQSRKLEEGTIVITPNQTKGRGQGGNMWLTEPGVNLTFSFLLKPEFLDPSRQFFLNMAIGLGIRDSIRHLTSLEPKLKWPNDILIDSTKVCGILIENQIHGTRFAQSVVGVGLNVNQKGFDLPNATSLSLSSGNYLNLTEVFETLLIKIESRYLQVKSRNFEQLKDEYCSALYWRNEMHEFSNGNEIFKGEIKGIDDVGRLLIETNGSSRKFNFKEVTFVR